MHYNKCKSCYNIPLVLCVGLNFFKSVWITWHDSLFKNNITGQQVKQSKRECEKGWGSVGDRSKVQFYYAFKYSETFFFFLVNHMCVLKADESGYESLILVLESHPVGRCHQWHGWGKNSLKQILLKKTGFCIKGKRSFSQVEVSILSFCFSLNVSIWLLVKFY